MRTLFLEIGLQRLLWPDKYGGDGHNNPKAAVTMVAALEQVSRGDTSIALLLSGMWALQSCMAMEGKENAEACEAFAGLFGSEDTLAVTSLVLPLFRDEPQAKAKLAKGAWSVEAKDARPMASGADAAVFGVLCALDGSEDEVGIIALPADDKGIKQGKPFLKTGLAARPQRRRLLR